MPTYTVNWTIEIEAESPREAAEFAREWQLDPDSEALHFVVRLGPSFPEYINL